MALVVFDLNGTLLDPGDQLPVLQQAVRLAMAHTLAEDVRPFAELLEAAGGEVPAAMPPFPDVLLGLERLQAQGHRLVVLTNSARDTAERHLRAAGIRERFAGVVGVDEVGAYKPARRVYAEGLRRLDGDPADAWMVSAHDWDLVGAHNAGLRTAFLRRSGPPPVTVPCDATATELGALEL